MNIRMWFYRCSLINDPPGGEKSIEGVLGNILKALKTKGRPTEEEMFDCWEKAVGVEASRHSKPQTLKGGILTVNVDSSGWLYQLTTQKKGVLERLAGKLGSKKIKDVRFRIGDIK